MRIYEPHIVAVVSHKLRRHLQKLQLAHLLQKEAHFQALHVGVTLELLRLEEHELVDSAELVVADFFGCGFIVSRVEWRLELDRDVVLFGGLGGEDAGLDVIDNHFVATGGPTQLGAVVEKLFLRDRVRRLLNFAAVDLGEAGSGPDWLLVFFAVVLVEVEAHPCVPRFGLGFVCDGGTGRKIGLLQVHRLQVVVFPDQGERLLLLLFLAARGGRHGPLRCSLLASRRKPSSRRLCCESVAGAAARRGFVDEAVGALGGFCLS